jgi:transcriptional regulator with XRE-family HTH domain/tetratricopeptide (TPR) repeat protein
MAAPMMGTGAPTSSPEPSAASAMSTVEIGVLIRDARRRLNWSQRVLARRLGVSQGYVALLETGERTPSEEIWARLIHMLRALPATSELVADIDLPEVTNPIARLSSEVIATHSEFQTERPSAKDWISQFRFTVVTGEAGSGKSSFIRSWLDELGSAGWTTGVIDLTYATEPEALDRSMRNVVSPFAPGTGSLEPTTNDPEALARRLISYVNDLVPHNVAVAFDNWAPRQGLVHETVGYLASRESKLRVLAATTAKAVSVPGAAIIPVPRPSESSWQSWCANWSVPESLRADLWLRSHGNALAAVLLRGSVYTALSENPALSIGDVWGDVVKRLPRSSDVPWAALLRVCEDYLGKQAWDLIKAVGASSEPLSTDAASRVASSKIFSRLLEYRFLLPVSGFSTPHLHVHEVIRASQQGDDRDELLGLGYPADTVQKPERSVESIAALARDWLNQRSNATPDEVIRSVEALDEREIGKAPDLVIALVRALALRGTSGDLERANEMSRGLLARRDLSAPILWEAFQQAADLAIRLRDYAHVSQYVDRAKALAESSAGVFRREPLAVLVARAAWEQSLFMDAEAALKDVEIEATVHGARVASWKARIHAALGDIPSAVRAAEAGIQAAVSSKNNRAEAYNSVLLAELEVMRGAHQQARRLAERARGLAEEVQQTDVVAQSLAVLADLAAARRAPEQAWGYIAQARERVSGRGNQAWAHAYLLVAEGKVMRTSSDWVRLVSTAQMLEGEARRVTPFAPAHPVVSLLLVEAAWCWAAVGYSHEARRVLDNLDLSSTLWRVQWEARRVAFLAGFGSGGEEVAMDLVREAEVHGCPYLAAECGYGLVVAGARRDNAALMERMAAWTAAVADARGWSDLALLARAYSPRPSSVGPVQPRLIVNPDGSTTVVMPPPPDRPSGMDPGVPLPDDFED